MARTFATGLLVAVAYYAGLVAAQDTMALPNCTSLAEFNTINKRLTDECCNERSESCATGVPATCNVGCSAVLLPAVQACVNDKDGVLKQQSMVIIKRAFTSAGSKCQGRIMPGGH